MTIEKLVEDMQYIVIFLNIHGTADLQKRAYNILDMLVDRRDGISLYDFVAKKLPPLQISKILEAAAQHADSTYEAATTLTREEQDVIFFEKIVQETKNAIGYKVEIDSRPYSID